MLNPSGPSETFRVKKGLEAPLRAKFGDHAKSNLHSSIYNLLHPLKLKASLFPPFVNCISLIMWLTETKISSKAMVVYIMFLSSDRRLGPGSKNKTVTYGPNAHTWV